MIIKAIPPARDRLQSRLLVWTVTPLIILACVQLIHWTVLMAPSWNSLTGKALLVSAIFALAARALRAATTGAALIGSMICLLLTCFTGWTIKSPMHSALSPLLILFVLTFLATKAGRKKKSQRGLTERGKGRRTSQVIANLGIAGLFPNIVGDRLIGWIALSPGVSDVNSFWFLQIILVAVLAEATADTVSSEIGQAFGGRPILLTTFGRVEPGVDGAITLMGTATGIFAGALVVVAGALSMRLDLHQSMIALVAAILGLFFDSLMGATLERGGYLGNDLVNFASTAFSAAIVFPLAYITMSFLRL